MNNTIKAVLLLLVLQIITCTALYFLSRQLAETAGRQQALDAKLNNIQDKIDQLEGKVPKGLEKIDYLGNEGENYG